MKDINYISSLSNIIYYPNPNIEKQRLHIVGRCRHFAKHTLIPGMHVLHVNRAFVDCCDVLSGSFC